MENEVKFQCPYCKKEIERINSRVNKIVYETAGLYYSESCNKIDTNDWDFCDDDYIDDSIYSCPECEKDFELSDIKIIKPKKPKTTKIDNGESENKEAIINKRKYKNETIECTAICPKCKHIFTKDPIGHHSYDIDYKKETEQTCPECYYSFIM